MKKVFRISGNVLQKNVNNKITKGSTKMKKDANIDYDAMTIEELEKHMTPRELTFITNYETTNNVAVSAQRVGYSPDNEKSAKTTGYKMLRKPKIAAYRRKRIDDMYENLSLCKEDIIMRLDDMYTHAMEAKPHMAWNPEKKVKEHDGTWEFDGKTALECLRLIGEAIGMFDNIPEEKPKILLDEYLKNLGEGQS